MNFCLVARCSAFTNSVEMSCAELPFSLVSKNDRWQSTDSGPLSYTVRYADIRWNEVLNILAHSFVVDKIQYSRQSGSLRWLRFRRIDGSSLSRRKTSGPVADLLSTRYITIFLLHNHSCWKYSLIQPNHPKLIENSDTVYQYLGHSSSIRAFPRLDENRQYFPLRSNSFSYAIVKTYLVIPDVHAVHRVIPYIDLRRCQQ